MATRQEFDHGGEFVLGTVSLYSEHGGRDYQEDRFVAETIQLSDTSLQILAVMDGHFGSQVAEIAANQLVGFIREADETTAESHKNIDGLLRLAVEKLSEETKEANTGSTLSVVAIPEDGQKAYVAVLGDSPVIISDGKDKISVSPEHNARSNKAEREKAESRGAVYGKDGYLHNKSGGLQLSRSLGNKDFGDFLERTPDTYSVDLGENSVIIVATDGVLDASHKTSLENNARFIATAVTRGGADAEALVRGAIARGGRDNATAIVWRRA